MSPLHNSPIQKTSSTPRQDTIVQHRRGCYFDTAGRMGGSSGSAFYSSSVAEMNVQKETDLRGQASRALSPALNVVAMVSSSPLPRDVAGQSIPGGAAGRVPGARSPVSLSSDLTSMILLGNTHHSLFNCVGIRS